MMIVVPADVSSFAIKVTNYARRFEGCMPCGHQENRLIHIKNFVRILIEAFEFKDSICGYQSLSPTRIRGIEYVDRSCICEKKPNAITFRAL